MFLTPNQQAKYVARGLAAYYRTGGVKPPQHTKVVIYKDRYYLYLYCDDLENDGILAVYRIENAARLKRLKRWPSDADREKASCDRLRQRNDEIAQRLGFIRAGVTA
jgi:hypothetical protein